MIDNIKTVYETYRAVVLKKRVPCPMCGALPERLATSSAREVLHDLDCAYEVWRFRMEAQHHVITAYAA